MAEVHYEKFHNTKVQDYDCVVVGSGFAEIRELLH